jgi:hypothetical protein
MRNIVCERCGNKFICKGSSNECWCFEKPYVRFDKTVTYKDCLCEKCLVELHNETSKNNNQG